MFLTPVSCAKSLIINDISATAVCVFPPGTGAGRALIEFDHFVQCRSRDGRGGAACQKKSCQEAAMS